MFPRRTECVLAFALILTGCRFARAQSTTTFKPAHWTGIFGFHIGTPDRISMVLGIGRVVSSRALGPATRSGKVPHTDRDIFAAFEPGSRGARLSLGYGGLKDMISSGTILSARVSAYRHWSNDSSRVYIGPEISGSAIADLPLGLRLGILRRVRGIRAGPSAALTRGIRAEPEGRRFIVPRDFAIGW
jgi:hypothetical protein